MTVLLFNIEEVAASVPVAVAPGALFDLTVRADPGQLAAITFEVRDALDLLVGAPVPPEVEVPVGGGEQADYTARLGAPALAGSYTVRAVTPGDTFDVPLVVRGWRPTVQDVAQVTPAYTRGGFDDDDEVAGREMLTYTDATSPTVAVVEGLITAAVDEVAGRAGTAIPLPYQGLARSTAKWHTAASIAASKRPAGTDDAGGEYSGHIANYRACLDRLVYLCGIGPTRLA